MRCFFPALFLVLLCTAGVIAEERSVVNEAPPEIWTDLNIVDSKTAPTWENSVSIGEIGKDYFVLHGQRYPIKAVVVVRAETHTGYQIVGHPDALGAWTLFIVDSNNPEKINKTGLVVIYVPRVKPEAPASGGKYNLILGKRPQ